MTLTMCVGLPGSGKSTWALKQCASNPNVIRVNKDDIRAALAKTGWTWSREHEKDVIRERDLTITSALVSGYDVISDDTNFARKHRERPKWLAEQHGATFVEKFFNVDVEEAIRRDAAREHPVGAAVIRGMAKQYLPPPIVPYVIDSALSWCVMCDLDGTAALIGARSPYDGGSCHLDAPNRPVHRTLDLFSSHGYMIVYMSGRDDAHFDKTMKWLSDHRFPEGELHMRKTGDARKDFVVKGELFDAHVRGRYNVMMVLDDRDSVVAYWRSLGLTCFQVAKGDF